MTSLPEPPIDFIKEKLDEAYRAGWDHGLYDEKQLASEIMARVVGAPANASPDPLLMERIETIRNFTSNRPAEYCHMFANAQKVIEELVALGKPVPATAGQSGGLPPFPSEISVDGLSFTQQDVDNLVSVYNHIALRDDLQESLFRAIKICKLSLRTTEPVSLAQMREKLRGQARGDYTIHQVLDAAGVKYVD